MLNYVIRYKFSVLLAALIALLCLLPSSRIPDPALFSIAFVDKIVHTSMYTALGCVVLLEKPLKNGTVGSEFLHLLILLFFSAIIEIIQYAFIASRSAEWLDLLANFSGLVLSWCLYRIYRLLRS